MLVIFLQLCNLVMNRTDSAPRRQQLQHLVFHIITKKKAKTEHPPSPSFLFLVPVTRKRWAPSHLLWTRSPGGGGVWCSDAAVFLFTLPLSFYSHLVVWASHRRRSLQVCCTSTQAQRLDFNTSKYFLSLLYVATFWWEHHRNRGQTHKYLAGANRYFFFLMFCVWCIGTYAASRHLHLVFMY